MPAVPSKLPSSLSPWTTDRIIDLVQRRFNKRPCYYQIEVAKALYAGRDVIGCAPTGAGKTLSFWIPLLMAQEEKQQRILFVVSPLNVLAKQNVSMLLDAGISAIAVAAENATASTFRDIEKGKYEVIVTNPEILMTNDNLRKLWNVSSFTSQILGFVFDEGHCIVQWGKFRKHYLAVGIIRHIIGAPIPFYVASATLPPPLIAEISRLLHADPRNTTQILCSNDRPDIALMVEPLRCPASSYEDLAFLIPYNWQESMDKPKKFLVFFDNIKEAEAATHFFQQRLLTKYHSRIAWFHSTMSQEYREGKLREFREGDIWGMFCTDAFGLGMDVGDVEVVVQYKATCDLNTLWQRFGRAARSSSGRGAGILLVEKKDCIASRKSGSASSSAGSKRSMDNLQNSVEKRRRRSGKPIAQLTVEGESEMLIEVDTSCQDTLPSAPNPCQATWSRERQARYARPEIAPGDPTNAKKGRMPGVLLGSAMDDYINLPSYISCRRLVPHLYFANDKRLSDSHIHCNPAIPAGCCRCKPKAMIFCCDRCSPIAFDTFRVSGCSKRKTTRRSIIPVCYTKSLQHPALEEAIYRWRESQAVELLGEGVVERLGVELVMSEDVIERVLACWTFKKITEVSHFRRETTWPEEWVEKCGQSLIDLLATYSPFEINALATSIDVKPVIPFVAVALPPPLFAPMPAPALTSSIVPKPPALTLSCTPMPAPALAPPSIVPIPPPFSLHAPAPLPSLPTTFAPIPLPVPLPHPASLHALAPPLTPIIPTVIPTVPRKRAPIRCSNCRLTGHNYRSCKTSKKIKMEYLEPLLQEAMSATATATGDLPLTIFQHAASGTNPLLSMP